MDNKQRFERNFGSKRNLPNPVMVTRQIDDLRDVLKRMKATQAQTFDTLTSQKIKGFQSS